MWKLNAASGILLIIICHCTVLSDCVHTVLHCVMFPMHVRYCVQSFLLRGMQCYYQSSHKYECTFKIETYELVRSECTSPQGSSRGEIEKQVVTTYRNTIEGVYSVKRYCCYQCHSSFVYHVL